jgi:CRP/FNR family transcriptional regulator, nitrogen fixation regulation protein
MLIQTAARGIRTSIPAHAPVDSQDLAGALGYMGVPISFARNSEVYGEAEPTDYLYRVLTGAVRTYKVLTDGRRQIGGFYLAGDVFGLEIGKEHTFSAEAITKARVLVVKRSALVTLANRDHEVARMLWALTGNELARAQRHILLLIKNAQERVASFLLEMAERVSANDSVELPMSRQDIADYLGLTIETVSRMLTVLERASAIKVTSRRVVLVNRSALSRIDI